MRKKCCTSMSQSFLMRSPGRMKAAKLMRRRKRLMTQKKLCGSRLLAHRQLHHQSLRSGDAGIDLGTSCHHKRV